LFVREKICARQPLDDWFCKHKYARLARLFAERIENGKNVDFEKFLCASAGSAN
jgi:hypothetical protein